MRIVNSHIAQQSISSGKPEHGPIRVCLSKRVLDRGMNGGVTPVNRDAASLNSGLLSDVAVSSFISLCLQMDG